MDHFDRSALLQFHQQVELFGLKNGGALQLYMEFTTG